MTSIIEARIRSFRYARAPSPILKDLQLSIGAGDFIVLCGAPGSGKSTLSQCLAGVIPHFVQGEYDGEVVVGGHRLNDLPLPRIAGIVGYVQQVPANQLFSLSVEEDVAFGPENLGLAPAEIRRRVHRALESVGIADLAQRLPHQLSGGQQQRAVLASVLALQPSCWIFDQPVAELDPVGRAEVYAVIQALNAADQTVVAIEERLSDVVHLATRIALIRGGRVVADDAPTRFFADSAHVDPRVGLRLPLAVQVFHHLRAAGVDLEAVPLTVSALADRLRSMSPGEIPPPVVTGVPTSSGGPLLCSARGLGFRYPTGHWALRDVTLEIHAGECVALIGANGAGKSTLAKHLIGLLQPTEGEVSVLGRDTRHQTTAELSHHVGFLFQDPDYQIFTSSALAEVEFALRARKVPAAAARERAMAELERVGLTEMAGLHPYRLSRGQRQLLALAAVRALDPRLMVVDEPSTGLDFTQTRAIMQQLDDFRAQGGGVLLISHDIEMVSRYSKRSVIMADGRVIADVLTADLGSYAGKLRTAGVRLPEIYELEAELGLPPAFCEPEALAGALAAALAQ